MGYRSTEISQNVNLLSQNYLEQSRSIDLYIDSKYSGEYCFRLGVGDEIPYDGTTVDKLSFHIDFDRDGDYWDDYIVSTVWPSLDGGQIKITHQT